MGIFVGMRVAIAALSVAAWCGEAWAAESPAESDAQPINGAFLQRDVGEEISAFTAGLMRKAPWTFFSDQVTVYGELSLSSWRSRTHAPSDSGALWQLGVTPVLRYTPAGMPIFTEFGVGLTLTSKIYRKNERQFSTAYNFGDHIAIGWTFGPRHENELAFRIEHFSNGNIKLPNPGENFRALRYVRWFD
jgi:lipid A 3-O-deacylase